MRAEVCRLSTEDTWACVRMHFRKMGEISELPEIYTDENALKHQVNVFAKTVLNGCQLCVQQPD